MPSRLSRRPRRRAGAALGAVALGVAALAVLTGCTHSAPTSAPSTSAATTPTPVPSPTTPFSATAPAAVAQSHFDYTVQTLLKTDPQPHGDDIIGALSRAGFDKADMQITPDTTTIGRNVDSIEFSVLWQKKTCLIGSVGASGYGSTTASVLSTGKCLVGTTRSIN